MPGDGALFFLDENFKIITDDNQVASWWIFPNWYGDLLLRYFSETEDAIAQYEALRHPPDTEEKKED